MTDADEPLASLGELCTDLVDQSGPTGEFIYVDISSIDREAKKIVEPKTLPLEKAPSRAKQVLKAGDVLVSMTRPNLNAVALVPEHLDGAIGSTGFHVLRSKWLHPQFLLGLVQSRAFVEAMSALVQGALYPAVRPKDIAAYQFRFEVPAQQARIAAKLEELLSDLDAGVTELKAAQKKLQQYRQSLLKAAVEGALTAAWREARRQHGTPTETGAQLLARILTERRARWEAKQLAKFGEQGKVPTKGWQEKYPEPVPPDTSDIPKLPEGWVWASVDQLSPDDLANGRSVLSAESGAKVLRLTAVRNGLIDLNEVKSGDWTLEEAKPFAIEAGDLLIVRGNGSKSLVGRVGLVGQVNEQVAYPDTLIRLRVCDEVVPSRWVALVWDSEIVRSHLEQRARTSAGIYKISQPDIVSACIPVPPTTEAKEAIARLELQLESVSEFDRTAGRLLQLSAAAQRQNILRAAFTGELVPQDPDDEPAGVLLERIHTERTQRGSKPKARRSKNYAEA